MIFFSMSAIFECDLSHLTLETLEKILENVKKIFTRHLMDNCER